MVKGKGNIFGQKETKEPKDQNIKKENISTDHPETSSAKMSESEEVETDEMREEALSTPGEAEQEIEFTPSEKEKELQGKVDELQDKYVRLMAEFDNYRRRTLKEKTDLIKSAGEDVLVSILPVIDDFERGLQVMEQAPDVESVKLGIQLIYNKFKDFMMQRGVKEIDSMHQDFNVEIHEALTKIPAPQENLKGKVLDVVQKGYYLNDKVIRYAKVIIGE
jgi:molecular chaperone GrpE